jgi:hypothetical protein
MSYARPMETGTYIYSDGEYMHFKLDTVSEDDINIFLYSLYSKRRKEFKPFTPRFVNGYLKRYSDCVKNASAGAVLK